MVAKVFVTRIKLRAIALASRATGLLAFSDTASVELISQRLRDGLAP